jgi:formate hydrogenlyase subunit 3/multisubunit Na+/H+ antiporter MnhD subunit
VNALAGALLFWTAGGLAALLFRRHAFAAPAAALATVAGGVLQAVAAFTVLREGLSESWELAWTLPVGALALRLDPLAAAFLLPAAVVGPLGAIYGVAYLRSHAHGGPIGGSLAAYQLLLASMTVVVTANDLVLFLIAWEIMTMSSWALVVTDQGIPSVRAAGTRYLVASHLATGMLFLLALSLSAGGGTNEIGALTGEATVPKGVLFLLATLGFGTKAAMVPLHVWLPDAHSAAPPHVSALMSAVMVTMGFYGLARFLPLLGEPQSWWAYVFLVLGAVGAIGGVVFAIVERDVKRVLAYSTVENAGIATLAVGLGVLGTAAGRPILAGFGWTAALLHLWNHALAKATLFFGFGVVAQSVGSRSLDAMGGLLGRWAGMGLLLVLAASALASLPGLNVFVGEWILMRGFLLGGVLTEGAARAALLAAVAVLALTGGLAVACFVRLVGLALLGTPRSEGAAHAAQPGWGFAAPMVALLMGSVAVAAFPALTAGLLRHAVTTVAPDADADAALRALRPLTVLLPLLAGAAAGVAMVRWLPGRRPAPTASTTWGCGYPSPTAAMQYTSTSFGEPLTRVLQPMIGSEARSEIRSAAGPDSLWPDHMSWVSTTTDRVVDALYEPLFAAVGRAGARLREYYRPRVTTSLLYIVVTVLVLLTLLFLPDAPR